MLRDVQADKEQVQVGSDGESQQMMVKKKKETKNDKSKKMLEVNCRME